MFMTSHGNPLLDPTRFTLSIGEAADALGVARSTAYNEARRTGFVTAGVPVIQIGKRLVVSANLLRQALCVDLPAAGSA